jgi:hypothetical protein
MENGMQEVFYSLEDRFDALTRSCRWRASRSAAALARNLFALLGDTLSEGRRHAPSLFTLPE